MKHFIQCCFCSLIFTFSSYAQTLKINVSTTSGCNDGSLTIDITEGAPPYQYFVTNGKFQYSSGIVESAHLELTELAHGNYSIRVWDNQSKVVEDQVKIQSTIELSYTKSDVTCNNNGAIQVQVQGGNAPYSYKLNTEETNSQLTNLPEGNYILTVTDAMGCTSISDTIFLMNRGLSVFASTTPYSCKQKGTAKAIIYGEGTEPYSYYWQTAPVQSLPVANDLFPGSYKLIVTDANGCTADATAHIWEMNTFQLETNITNADCEQANGSILAIPSGGKAPYTYSWYNNESTALIENLTGEKTYDVTVTDADGCVSKATSYVGKNSPLEVAFSTTSSSCQASDGVITAIPTHGTAPYSYEWNGEAPSGATLNDIGPGLYYLKLTDASGCKKHFRTQLKEQSNCKSKITGTAFYDINGNCAQDEGEEGIPYALIKYGDTKWIYANHQGYYELEVYPGTYTIESWPKQNWINTCSNQSYTIDVATGGNTYSNNDFFHSSEYTISDVYIKMYASNQRPGETRTVSLYYGNLGTQIENGTITYTYSEGWNFSFASPMPDSYNAENRTLSWNVESLNPNYTKSISISMSVPTSTQMNDILTAEASINILNTDHNNNDNTILVNALVTNSYDPNDIQVSPQGNGDEGFITEQLDALTYRIRFQNTGNDVAYNVTVKNKIDPYVEDYTISILDVSHNVIASIENDSLRFDFNDIYLADSTSNEPESHGYIIYRVNKKSGLAPLTQIVNQADIYFDYNPAVITNQVKNTIANTTFVVSEQKLDDEVLFYPNPCTDKLHLAIELKEPTLLTLSLYAANGRHVEILKDLSLDQGAQLIELDLSKLQIPAGLYVAKVVMENSVYTRSIIISQ